MGRKRLRLTLTAQEIECLKELSGAGDRGRTIKASASRNGLHRLFDAGYVDRQPIRMDDVLYKITDTGRRALAEAKQ